MHGKNHSHGEARPAPPELRLQVIDRHSAFQECNYSLYPSWLAYPWPNAHLVIRGNRPYSLYRCDRTTPDGEPSPIPSSLKVSTQHTDGLSASEVFAALREFAVSSPRPSKVLLNLNTEAKSQCVTGQLVVLGCRIASVGRTGELNTLVGLEFAPELRAGPGVSTRTNGLRVRHRILIHPGTRVKLALPHALADAARKRPRPGRRIEQIEILPSIFTDTTSFRALWPEGPDPQAGKRYEICFDGSAESAGPRLKPVTLEQPPAVEETSEQAALEEACGD